MRQIKVHKKESAVAELLFCMRKIKKVTDGENNDIICNTILTQDLKYGKYGKCGVYRICKNEGK